MSRFSRALALALAFAGTSVLHAQQTPLNIQQADALGSDLFVRSGSTGMVMVVVRGRQTHFFSYGETALGNGLRPTPDSLLRLCSLTKIFTTDLLVKLTGDGTVHLDDPLQRFTSAHTLVPSRQGRSITLKDLATHTAGLPREVGNAPRGTPHFTYPDAAFRWRWLPTQHLHATPGTVALYSNIGFDLLGDALQSAAQEPYPALLGERTTAPLGMSQTGYAPTAEQCARLLQGAHNEGPCTDTHNTAGAAGLYSTATDMTRWLQYLLGTGTPELPAQTPAAEAVYIAPAALHAQSGLDHAGSPSGIGLGWMHLLDDANPSSIIEKTGGGAGFLTYIALNQPNHTGIFIAVTDGPVETHLNVFRTANDLLLALSGLPPLPPDPPKPTPAPAARKTPVHQHATSHEDSRSSTGSRTSRTPNLASTARTIAP